jgi:Rod binding domain-containing protein
MAKNMPARVTAQKMQRVSEENFAEQMRSLAESGDVKAEQREEIAQKFAGVFYSMLFKTMQETIPDQDDSAISSGMRGLVSRYMPRVMANTSSDPITRYIEKNLNLQDERGGDINEQA